MNKIILIVFLFCSGAWAQEANLVPIMKTNTTCGAFCTVGVASASTTVAGSSTADGGAWVAFCDVNGANQGGICQGFGGWLATTSTGYLCYQFASAQIVTTYSITPWSVDNFPTRSPKTWTFEGSNTSCTASTTTLDTQTTFTSWVSNTPHAFSFSNTTAYLYYRVNISLNGGAGNVGIQRLTMGGKASGQIFSPNYNPMASLNTPSPFANFSNGDTTGRRAYEVWDQYISTNQYWLASAVSLPQWNALDTGSGKSHVVGSYNVIFPDATATVDFTLAPKDWTLNGSNDTSTCTNAGGSTWTALDTETNQTSWTSSQIRTFTPACVGAAYRCFQINITANNGNATPQTAIGEVQFIEGTTGAGCPATGQPWAIVVN